MPEQHATVGDRHGNIVAIARPEFRVGVNINLLHLRFRDCGDKCTLGVFAEVAPLARVEEDAGHVDNQYLSGS